MDKNQSEKKCFYEQGLNFECQRCSFCCGNSPGFVYLSLQDLQRLCKYYELSYEDFVNKYCRWADYYYGKKVLALLEQKNYDCILWENGCKAYTARPIQCSTYPFWSWMIADEQTWIECGKDCPGINKGKLWTKQKIEDNKNKYVKNEPLTREQYLNLLEKDL